MPIRRNSVLDGLRSSFVQVHPGKNVSESGGVSKDRAEFVGVKEMYS